MKRIFAIAVAVLLVSSWASADDGDGVGPTDSFDWLGAVAVDGAGNVFVADVSHDSIRKISPDLVVSTWAGSPHLLDYVRGNKIHVDLDGVVGIAVDPQGNLIASTRNGVVKIKSDGTVRQLVKTVPGAAPAVKEAHDLTRMSKSHMSSWPYRVVTGPRGSVIVVDGVKGTVRSISEEGAETVLINTHDPSFSAKQGDNFPALIDAALDKAGNLYILCRDRVLKLNKSGELVTMLGPLKTVNYFYEDEMVGKPRRDEEAVFLSGIAVGSAGDVYVSDARSSTIDRITPDGKLSVFAGKPGSGQPGFGWLDGQGQQATFSRPKALTIDAAGNLYVVDEILDAFDLVRKITPQGVVSTMAGNAEERFRKMRPLI